MRGERIEPRRVIYLGAEPAAPPPPARIPIVPILGIAAIGLTVVAVVRDEHRATREKW